jgi:succinoglycan biosynthesis protein ExoO
MSEMNQLSSPKIGVVVAAHNAERTIGATISSLLHQSLSDIEVLVCNDASTDSTESVIKSFHDPRIKYLVNGTNCGPGVSRDLGIQESIAPWVAIVDADDVCHPLRLERMLSAGEASGADFIFDDILLCHDTDGSLVPWTFVHGPNAFGQSFGTARVIRVEDYVCGDRLVAQPLIRTSFIRRHAICHSQRRFAEDAEFYLRIALAGARFCYVPEPLYYYRITPGSLTAQARDPTLMRQCLEECAQWDGWWPSARAALETKVASLRTNEALYTFARAIRSANFGDAARMIASEPRLLAILPRRLIRQFHYQAHRMIHGGRRR